MEEESSMKSLRSGSITHGKEMSFQDFADLFMTFSIRLRKDIFNIFKTHSVYSRKIERLQNSCGSSEESETADLEASTKTAQSVAASVTRNTSGDQVDFRARSEKKKIYDAMAVASILNNSAGLDTSKDLVLPADALLHFISHYQGEQLTIEEAEHLVTQHEPHPELRRQHLLSFEGFARFLMDRDNEAIRKGPVDYNIYFYILQYIIYYRSCGRGNDDSPSVPLLHRLLTQHLLDRAPTEGPLLCRALPSDSPFRVSLRRT